MSKEDKKLELEVNLTLEGEGGIFYTIQGEGKYTGYPTVFIRTSICNLRCAWKNPDGSITKCDTPHSSFNPEKNIRTIGDIVENVKKFSDRAHAVLTGGEPVLSKNYTELVDTLVENGYYVTIETNGTVYKESKAQFISLSPKLSSSNALKNGRKRIVPEAIEQFIENHDYQVKFVVNDESDLEEILDFQKQFNIPDNNIYVMAQGIDEDQIKDKAKWMISEICLKYGWKYSDRLHIQIWGGKTLGV